MIFASVCPLVSVSGGEGSCRMFPCALQQPLPGTSPARHSSRGFCLHQTIEYGELLSNSATRTQQIVLIFQRTQTDCLFKPLQLDAFIFSLSRNKRRIFNKHQTGSCCQLPLLPPPGLHNFKELWQLGDIQITSSFLYILNPWPELLIFLKSPRVDRLKKLL